MYLFRPFSVLVLLLLWSAPAVAHGDLDEQIEEATKQIQINPDSADLYFYRGKLRYQHEEFATSLTDLVHAHKLGFDEIELDYFSAKVHFALQDFEAALQSIRSILTLIPHDVTALKIKAQILHASGSFEDAAETHGMVIKHSIRTFPENYLAAAKAWLDSKVVGAVDSALMLLDQGIYVLGPTYTLIQRKKEIYVAQGELTNAMIEQQKVIVLSQRKEMPLFGAAEIALMMGDVDQARRYLLESRSAILKLPSEILKSVAMQTLDRQSRIFLTELNSY